MFDPAGEPSRLRTFGLLSLRRRWKLIGMCGALSLIVVLLVIVFKPRTYTASTQLLVYVREIHLSPEPVVIPGSADLVQVQNEIEIIQSRGMLAAVAGSLGLADDEEFVPAASGIRTVAERIFRRQGAAFEKGDGRLNDVRLNVAVEALKRRLVVNRVGASHTIVVSVTTSDARKSERIANAIGQSALEARVGIDRDNSKSALQRQRLQGLGPSAYVMSAAGAPGRPDGPRKIVLIPGALAFGIALGSALALLLDFRNSTVRTAAQVEYLGLECIGPVPLLRRGSPMNAQEVVAGCELAGGNEFLPNPMLEQTLRRVRAAIENTTARTIGITSAVGREGAATIAAHLARACRGRKVLLVEAGLNERPLNELPLSLSGAGPIDQVSDLNSLGDYDVIIVSLPPLELGPEFRMAARNLDALLLVIRWGSTELETVERTMAGSSVPPSHFIGAVLNMVDERMIGKFGDKLWNAEAALAARRASLAFNT